MLKRNILCKPTISLPSINRRRALSIIVGSMAFPSVAQAVELVQQTQLPRLRRLHLVNAHTGESFEGPNRDGNGPLSSAMEDLSNFLRDFIPEPRSISTLPLSIFSPA